MPLQILELPKQFRSQTRITYPPFKNGRYMEEYFYDYCILHRDEITYNRVYIPAFWTNIQTHSGFASHRSGYQTLLTLAFKKMPSDTKYFTVVQHDDGVLFNLPPNTLVFGACSGDVPLPLIYEDTENTLSQSVQCDKKEYLASFIGTITHPLRRRLVSVIGTHRDIRCISQDKWTNTVSDALAKIFINTTLASKFCLAPRGYGRSSFRYFEAILLNCIPVYFWNDIEWLPYKDVIDYSLFSVSICEKDISNTYSILASISDEKYEKMLQELQKVKHWFTLEGMCEYILQYKYNAI